MKKFNRKGMRNNTKDNSQDKYSHKGFTFKFDDKGLQESYVETYEKHKYLELDLPTSQIAYIDAVSIVRGKNNQRLELLDERYNENDANYSRSLKHKYELFDSVRERYKTQFNRQLIKLEQYFNLVDEETERFNTAHPKGQLSDGKVSRYNVIWYSKTKEGSTVAV